MAITAGMVGQSTPTANQNLGAGNDFVRALVSRKVLRSTNLILLIYQPKSR
jgi:hypothetical protein